MCIRDRVGRRRAAEGLQAGQRRMAEAQERHQEGRQGYFARADSPLCQTQGQQGIRIYARQLSAARAGGVVPVGGHARPADDRGGRQEGHGVRPELCIRDRRQVVETADDGVNLFGGTHNLLLFGDVFLHGCI